MILRKLVGYSNRFLAAAFTVVLIAIGQVSFAHNYFAPFMYMSGLYSDGEAIYYPTASDEEMDWLLKQIQDPYSSMRSIAAGALGQTGDPRAVEPLLKALGDKSASVRSNAAMAFVHIKDPRVVPALKDIMANPNAAYEAVGAVYALVAQGDDGISALIDYYWKQDRDHESGPETDVAECVFFGMGSQSINWAAEKLKSPDKRVRSVAITLLSDFLENNDPKSPSISAVFNSALSDPAAQQAVVEMVLAPDSTVARPALTMLYVADAKDAIAKIREAAQDKSRKNRQSLQVLLESSNQESTNTKSIRGQNFTNAEINQLVSVVKQARLVFSNGSEGPQEKCVVAAERLAASSNPKAVSALVELLKSKNEMVSETASDALDDSNNPLVIKVLLKVAAQKKSPIMNQAIMLLLEKTDRSLIPFCLSMLKSKNHHVVAMAIQSLGDVGDPKVAPHLVKMLAKSEYQNMTISSLEKLKNPIAISPLISLLGNSKYAHKEIVNAIATCGPSAVDIAISRLNDKKPAVRLGVVQVLAKFNAPKSTNALVSAMSDNNANVRAAVVLALMDRKNSEAKSVLAKALKDSDVRVRRVAAYSATVSPDPQLVDTFVSLLRDKDQEIKTCAGIALGQLGDKRGTDVVLAVLDPESESERTADMALAAIRAAGVLKEERAVVYILACLPADISMSVFDGGSPEQRSESRKIKLEALRSITGKDYGNAYYRWMAYWVAQGHKLTDLFGESDPVDNEESYDEFDEEPGDQTEESEY